MSAPTADAVEAARVALSPWLALIGEQAPMAMARVAAALDAFVAARLDTEATNIDRCGYERGVREAAEIAKQYTYTSGAILGLLDKEIVRGDIVELLVDKTHALPSLTMTVYKGSRGRVAQVEGKCCLVDFLDGAEHVQLAVGRSVLLKVTT